MFYKDPDHHAVLCAQPMEHGGEAKGERAFFPLLFFLSFLRPFPSNPSTAAHIQLLAIIPIDPLPSPNGVWVSEGFLFVPDNPMLQAGSREEVRSQLPGDGDWEWSGCDLFSMEQSQSKANVGWEADRSIAPASSRAASLLSSGRLSECWWCWRGERGERESKMKERGWPAERDEVRSFLHSYLALSGFLHQSLPLPALVGTFQPPPSPEVLEGRCLSYLPCLSFAPVLNLHGECVLTGMNSVPLDLWGLVPPSHSQNVFCGQQPSLTD